MDSIHEDEKLLHVAEEVDDFIVQFCNKHKMPLLSFMAIVLARFTVFSKNYKLDNELMHLIGCTRLRLTDKTEDAKVH